jgi:hypothetical protein
MKGDMYRDLKDLKILHPETVISLKDQMKQADRNVYHFN